jgi:hypothetical protein
MKEFNDDEFDIEKDEEDRNIWKQKYKDSEYKKEQERIGLIYNPDLQNIFDSKTYIK